MTKIEKQYIEWEKSYQEKTNTCPSCKSKLNIFKMPYTTQYKANCANCNWYTVGKTEKEVIQNVLNKKSKKINHAKTKPIV